jgi:hypothetical protein
MTKYIDLDACDPELVVVQHGGDTYGGTLEEFQTAMTEMRREALLDSVVALRVRILELETELREGRHAAESPSPSYCDCCGIELCDDTVVD